jgi:protein ImuA
MRVIGTHAGIAGAHAGTAGAAGIVGGPGMAGASVVPAVGASAPPHAFRAGGAAAPPRGAFKGGVAAGLHRARLERLRATIAGLAPLPASVASDEGAPARGADRPPLALLPHALMELRVADGRSRPAASALALALAGARAEASKASGRVVVIGLAHAAREDGVVFARGLAAFGLDPARLLAVFARNERELLWAAEEAARTRGVDMVLIEAPLGARRLDLTATRRLALAAEGSGAAPVLIRTDREAPPTAAAARLLVAPAPSAGERDDLQSPGAARWRIAIERYRPDPAWCAHGPFEAEWRHERRDFVFPDRPGEDDEDNEDGAAAPHRLSHPALLAGRPPAPARDRRAS